MSRCRAVNTGDVNNGIFSHRSVANNCYFVLSNEANKNVGPAAKLLFNRTITMILEYEHGIS